MEFEDFVDREFAGLGRFATALTGDRQRGEDVLVDALVKVSGRWRRVSRADSPAAYTRRVIVRTFLAHQRRASTRREVPTSDLRLLDTEVGDPTDDVVTRDQVRHLLDALTPSQRTAIVMRYILDSPDVEIAEALGCSAATVRSHLSHARQVLRLASDEDRAAHEGNTA